MTEAEYRALVLAELRAIRAAVEAPLLAAAPAPAQAAPAPPVAGPPPVVPDTAGAPQGARERLLAQVREASPLDDG